MNSMESSPSNRDNITNRFSISKITKNAEYVSFLGLE
jgi:hypothetical protein